MAKIPWKTKAEIDAEKAQQERQRQISKLENLLRERYEAHSRLLATDADEDEIEEVKQEITAILAELEVLYRAEPA